MGKAYDVSSGKYEVAKKAYVVEGSKYVKLPKAFVVEGGKYVKLWSGSNPNKLVVALNNKYQSSTWYSNTVFTAEDFSSPSNVNVATYDDYTFTVTNGYLLNDEYVFPTSSWMIYHCSSDDALASVIDVSDEYSYGFVISNTGLDRATNTMYGIYTDQTTLGGGTGGSGGKRNFYLQCLPPDKKAARARLTSDYPPVTGDARPAFDWSITIASSGISGSTSDYVNGSVAVYNNTAYVVIMKYYMSGSTSGSGTRFDPNLYKIDLSTNIMSQVTSLSSTYYTGYNTSTNNRQLLSFSDGLLAFIDKSIYKLDGSSLTKLTDVYTASWPGDYYKDRIIRISDTKFLIFVHNGGNSYKNYLYEFKNGSLTLLDTITTTYAGGYKSVAVGDALVYAYTNPDGTGYTNVCYSLDYGATFTTNKVSNSDIGMSNSFSGGTAYHVVAETIY